MPGREDRVRAPQTRMPRPGKARMQLMPTGLSRSCSFLVICTSSAIAPRTTSFAGRLVHAAGVVVAAPDAGDVARRRHEACSCRSPGRTTLIHG